MSVTLSAAAVVGMDDLSWKEEPLSPDLGGLDVGAGISWPFDDDDDDVAEQLYPAKEEKPDVPAPCGRAEAAAKLLQDLNDWIKEEPFPEWMEEKGDLGIFESLPLETSNLAIPEAVKKLPVAHKEGVSDTSFLLQEFQSIYDQLELNNASLTPPQSPTLPSYTNIYNVADSLVISQPQQLAQVQFIQVTPLVPAAYLGKKDPFVVPVAFVEKKPEEPLLTSFEQIVPATPSTDLAHEMTVVDELVRMCADEMVPDVETSSTSGKSWVENGERESPVSSDGGSDSEVLFSYPPSPYLSSSSRSSSGDEDPDYAPCVVPHSAGTGKGGRGKKRSAKDHVSPAPDEKKMRKKEQNKNAATRYRKKKKAEIEEILGEEKGLEVKNDELNKQVEDLSREIRYLKGFMRDIFKAKGFIK